MRAIFPPAARLGVNKRNQQLYEKWILLIVMAKAAGMMSHLSTDILSRHEMNCIFTSTQSILEISFSCLAPGTIVTTGFKQDSECLIQ